VYYVLDLPVIEQQLVCELHDTAPKLSQTDELASALGITNIHDVSRHLQSLRQRGLVVSQEERGSLFWTCSPVREKGRV
jgi:predicted transcriptional regulator